MISTAQLADTLKGRLITPDDPAYDDTRRVVPGAIDRHPAVIARVTDADDVATVIRAARESGQELAVRSGGHSGAGHGVSEGGIVLDLRDLNALDLDPQARTAWAETGLTAGAYTVAAGAHGLATGFGDTASVGVGGITLGGGIGFLVRKHGMTIDALLAAEVVTADGELVRADAESHPDLFWAIRGGGGNFGVATRLQFRLDPVEAVVGGMLILPASAEVVDGFMAEAAAAPEELSAIVVVMKAPPMPFLPAEAHGKLIVLAQMAYAGPVDRAERALAPFRSLAEPIADMLRPMAYADIYPPEDEEFRPIAALRTMFMDGFDSRDAEAIIEAIEASTAPMAAAQLRVLGGAMARVPSDATAFAHRDRPIMANVTSVATSVDALDGPAAWVADLSQRLSRGDEAGYVGFLGDEGEARVRAAYPGSTYERLAAVKAQYDPDNVFRLNQNIPPAA
jgi:FAD/FMN-containing dehydrogenase